MNQVYPNNKLKPVTLTEMCRFFGQHIICAALHLPSARDLWREHDFTIWYEGKEFGLGCHHWEEINSHLTFEPKVLRDMLVTLFQSHMTPETNLSCDETRIRAHHEGAPEVEFNPKKPERWAVQLYSLNLSNKYLYNFTVPKEMTAFQALKYFTNKLSTTGNVHHITADSHFSNAAQAQALMDTGIFCTLCCKADSAPRALFSTGLAQGLPQWKSRFARKGALIAACLHRKKKVCLISSWYRLQDTEKSGAAERRVLIDHYDDTKRYTDQFNLLVGNYYTPHRHRDVNANMLLGWFEFALTNAYILYTEYADKPVSHRDFLLSISQSLLKFPWK